MKGVTDTCIAYKYISREGQNVKLTTLQCNVGLMMTVIFTQSEDSSKNAIKRWIKQGLAL